MADEIKHVKNKNIIHNDDYAPGEEYDAYYEEYCDELEEYKQEEYFKDVSNYIYTNIMGFVNDKSLPLCEYLKPISLQRFMDSNIF